MSDTQEYLGTRDFVSSSSDLETQRFVVKQLLAKIPGSTLVQVRSVTNAGGISPVGFVDVQPMVHQIDGFGNVTPHGIIHQVPYFRLQGGSNAVIIDPQVLDIGIAVFASRDITNVKSAKKSSPPGSRRQNDWGDGLYIGGVLNGVPNQYIAFSADGISISTPNNLTITARNAILDASGNLAVTGEVVRGANTSDQVQLGTHRHGTGTSAAGTVPPTPGT